MDSVQIETIWGAIGGGGGGSGGGGGVGGGGKEAIGVVEKKESDARKRQDKKVFYSNWDYNEEIFEKVHLVGGRGVQGMARVQISSGAEANYSIILPAYPADGKKVVGFTVQCCKS